MHQCVYVLIDPNTNNIERAVVRALAPFDENLSVPPYKVYLSHAATVEMASCHRLDPNDLPALAPLIEDWIGGEGGIDDTGLFSKRTTNPHGEWDWYEIGGRWDGYLHGRTAAPSDEVPGTAENNSVLAASLLKNRELASRLPAAILTPTGQWIEKSPFITTMSGWFIAEHTKAEWLAFTRRILTAFPKHIVVCVDVHF